MDIPEQSVINTDSEKAGKPFDIDEDEHLGQSGDLDDIPIASDKEEACTLSTISVP